MLARFKAHTFSDLFQQLNQKYLVKPKITCKWQWFLHNKDLNSTLTNFVIMCVQLTHVPQENEQILLNESNKLYFIIMLHKNFIILLFVSITRYYKSPNKDSWITMNSLFKLNTTQSENFNTQTEYFLWPWAGPLKNGYLVPAGGQSMV